jgi:hypothetical protein
MRRIKQTGGRQAEQRRYASETNREIRSVIWAAMANKMAGRVAGFSFKAWIRGKAARQAGQGGKRVQPLSTDARIRGYRAQRFGTEVRMANVLTAAQVRRIEHKAAKAGTLADARLALAGRRVRVGNHTRVLYPELNV